MIAEGERIFFRVTGTHTVYLTGNYVTPLDEPEEDSEDEDDEDDYDLSPDEDELALMGEDDEESDELDDMDDPRVMEIDSEEEARIKAPAKASKGKNKRAAEENLDDMMAKAEKANAKSATNGEQPLSKKQQKKLKKNNGEAAEAPQKQAEAQPTPAKSDKKVQFAKNLEQGPTGSTQQKKETGKAEGTTGTLGVKEVQGVKIEDKKLGKGAAAKKGDRVSMRYIGKLENGKVFDGK